MNNRNDRLPKFWQPQTNLEDETTHFNKGVRAVFA
jgi:hypothetical protein